MASEEHNWQFIQNGFGDRYLHEVNGSAFNKLGADACFASHYGEALFLKNNLYLICGTDSGLLPAYIASKGVPEGSYYIFIELPEVLDVVNSVVPEGGYHEKIILTTKDGWVEHAKEIEYQNFVYLNQFNFVLSYAATDGHYIEYLDFATSLQEDLEKIKWGLVAELGNQSFSLCQMTNLPENRIPVSRLKEAFSGEVAIVLGGGPSLDEIFPWLFANRDKVVVFAVSRIARRLVDVGLSPDFIVSIDPTGLSFDISKEMFSLDGNVIFLHKYHVVSTLLGQWKGRSFFSGTRTPWTSELNEGLTDTAGPTVTNTAIDMALMMGFSNILLAGVDLCYSSDGYTHAKGSNERKVGPQLGAGRLWVETNSGEMAETTADFHYAAMRINYQALVAKNLGARVVNLSAAATKLDEVEFLSCDEITLSPRQMPAWDTVAAVCPPETSADRLAYYGQALNEVVRAQEAFREIGKLAREGLKANEAFFGKRKTGVGQKKHKQKMDRVEKKLNSGFDDFSRLIKKFGIKDFLKMTKGDRGRELDRDDVERIGQSYYEAYINATDSLLDMVKVAADRLKERIEEEQPVPDFSRLVAQWEKDRQPGRVLVWKSLHPATTIPGDVATDFQRLEQVFRDELEKTETVHARKSKERANLGIVRGKLQLMFRRRQVDHLRHMVKGLERVDGVEAETLLALGQGYLADLDNDADAALQKYQKVIDLQEDEPNLNILENALKRIMSLLLTAENYEDGKVVAECLAGISVANIPYYADLLWILGEKRTALDVYASYLEQVPHDTATMIKIGRYYLDIGITEGAKLMFDTVLKYQPDNQKVKELRANLD